MDLADPVLDLAWLCNYPEPYRGERFPRAFLVVATG